MGIAVYTVGGCFAEEVADSTISHILNLYRKTNLVAEQVKNGTIILYTLYSINRDYFQEKNLKMLNK